MKKTQLALAVCLALAGSAQAGTYSNFIVFGDSLSDAGTFGASFTTNPGTVWSENASGALGFTAAPAQLFDGTSFVATGGNIWAQGGARVNASPGVGLVVAESLATQVDTYLAGSGSASSSALYALWGGANDIFFEAASGASSAVIQANVATAAQDLAAQAGRLQAAGARYIVVMNLPDMGQTPAALAAGASAATALSGLSLLYNITLDSALSSAGVQALRLDSYRLFNEILADPSAYGLSVGNTGVACTTASSLTCTPATLASVTAAATYLFADGVHPTTAAHEILSDYTLSALRAPAVVAGTAERLAGVADGQWLGSDGRQRRFLDGLQSEDGADFYVTGEAGDARLDAGDDQPELDGNRGSLRVGVDRNFGSGWFGGLSVAYVGDRFDLSSLGSGRGRGLAINGYGSKRFGPAYVSAAATLASVNYDVERDFDLGAARREESGKASGNVKGLRMEVGYDLAQGPLRHGPLLALSYRRVRLAGYSETSGRSTAMAFGAQQFDQLRSSLGYQASWQATGRLRLSGRLTWENETMDSERDLSFGLATNSGRIGIPVGRDGTSCAQLNLGADWALTPTSAIAATLAATSGDQGSRREAVLVTYSSRF